MKETIKLGRRAQPSSRPAISGAPARARACDFADGTDSNRVAVGSRPPGRPSPRRTGRPNSRIDSAIGSYRIARRLGSGGTSVVYLARHVEQGRPFALKVMRRHLSSDAELVDRFEREALMLAGLAQAGVPRLIDRGRTDDGAPYLVMNLLVGQTLADRLDLGPMAVPDILDIAHQAAHTLSAVHAAGLVHCDVKPENLVLTPNPLGGSRYRVVVIDFGAVSVPALRAPRSHSPHQFRRLFGTPAYMAPEQCRRGSPLDPRTDVYGFGCLLFEMLCGRPPFEGTIAEVLAAHQAATRPRVTALRPDAPERLDRLILSMIASDPGRRPATMADVQRGLAEAMLPPPMHPAPHLPGA